MNVMELYTASEAAAILKVSKWTIWKYGRDGKLRTEHYGRTVRYYIGREDIDEVQSNTEEQLQGTGISV